MRSVNQKDRNTLFSRLLLTILPIALIPLVIASALGLYHANRRSTSSELIKLQKDANLVSEATQLSIDKALSISRAIAESPSKIALLKSTSDIIAREKLLELPISEQERRARALQTNKTIDKHLRATANSNGFTDILLTERNGFNVAGSRTPDSVIQRDTKWWRSSIERGWSLTCPEFDRPTNTWAVPISRSVRDPKTSQILGVIKASFHVPQLEARIEDYVSIDPNSSHSAHIIVPESGNTITNLSAPKYKKYLSELIKDKTLIKVSRLLERYQFSPDRLKQEIATIPTVEIEDFQIDRDGKVQVTIEYQNRIWSMREIPLTPWVSITSIDTAEVMAPAIELLVTFSLTGLLLGCIAVWASLRLACYLSQPIHKLTDTARQMADGNLDHRANTSEGTIEVRALALAFNELVDRVNGLLTEQKRQSDALEAGIWQLVEDVEGVIDGDLTVRASLDSMEMSTVADLFNAAIDNLRDIAIEVRTSTDRVNQAIASSELSSNELFDTSVTTATQIDRALLAIATISAANQSMASRIADIRTQIAPSSMVVNPSIPPDLIPIATVTEPLAMVEFSRSIATLVTTQSAAAEEIETILAQLAATTTEADRIAKQMKESMRSTAEIARHLASKVDRFKV
jgi:methyl-accepting chemotaxis protein PixJ